MEAKSAAMDMLLEMLIDHAPDEKKPMFLLPKVVNKLVNTTMHMMDAVKTQKTEADELNCARQAITILEDAQETFDNFLRSKGVTN